MINVLIADDHQFLLDGFSAIIDKVPNIQISATAVNGKQVIEELKNNNVDIALLDINMPVMDGIETCKIIQESFPHVKVIALSMHKSSSFIKRMIQQGAKGYILKDDPAKEIIEGIETVKAGDTYYSKRVMDIVLSFKNEKTGNDLSEREIEVLQLISKGFTNQEIALKLFLSPHTTESHRRHLLAKMQAKNTADLVRISLEKGII